MENLINLEDNDMCYACGKKNTHGLHLEFTLCERDKSIETNFLPSELHQGWEGIVHGGVIATVMDEAMAKMAQLLGYHVVTASLDVRFKDMAKTRELLKVRAEVTKLSKKLIFTKAVAHREDGKIIAEARAKLMVC